MVDKIYLPNGESKYIVPEKPGKPQVTTLDELPEPSNTTYGEVTVERLPYFLVGFVFGLFTAAVIAAVLMAGA